MNYQRAIFWLLVVVAVIVGIRVMVAGFHHQQQAYERCVRIYNQADC